MHLQKEINLLRQEILKLRHEIQDYKSELSSLKIENDELKKSLFDARMNEAGLEDEIHFYRNERRS